MANDKFPGSQVATITSSADTYESITASDAVDLPYITREVTVGTAGDLQVTRASDNKVVVIPSAIWTAQPTHAIRASKIWATNTTASAIFVKY